MTPSPSSTRKDQVYEKEVIPHDEMDLLHKTVQAFAQVVGKDIALTQKNGQTSYVYWDGNYQRFDIAVDQNVDGLKKITKVEHELGHIVWKTSVKEIQVEMENIMAGTPDLDIPSFHERCKELVHQLYNILEDERTESNTGAIYAGSKRQFQLSKETHHKINKPQQKEMDPVCAIFCARFGHDDLINGTDYEIAKEYLEQVKHKDEKAGVILTKMFWQEQVIPWLQKQKDKMENPEGKPKPKEKGKDGEGKSGKGKSVDEKLDDFDKKSDEEREAEIKKAKDRIKEKEKTLGESAKERKAKDKIRAEIEKVLDDAKDDKSHGHSHLRPDRDDTEEINWDDTEGELKNSEEKFKEDLAEVQERLANPVERDTDGKILLEHLKEKLIEKIERPRMDVNPDKVLARALNQMFKRIKGKHTDTIEIAGGDIDIDEYIQAKVKRTGEFFVEEVETGGLSIVIGVDLSGSMGSHRISVCRDMCGTLFKSLQGVDDVDLKIVAWSSPSSAYKLSVTDIVKYEDVEKISSQRGHEQNANHLAHQYIDEMLRKSKTQKKLCIMLTDGVPWMDTGRRDYSMETLLDLTKQAIDDTRRHGNKVFGIYVGDNETEVGLMKQMYGKDFVAVDEIEEARQKVTRAFEAHVVNQMRAV